MAVRGILPDFIPTANISVRVSAEFCPLKSRLQERVKTCACLRSAIRELEGIQEPLSGERREPRSARFGRRPERRPQRAHRGSFLREGGTALQGVRPDRFHARLEGGKAGAQRKS